MINKVSRNDVRKARHARVRTKVVGTASVPRLNVFRSNQNIFAQIIDDESATTFTHPIHAVQPAPSIQEIEEVKEEEPLSLEEIEKDVIRKTLEKYNGRRKYAAADLKISERTLYRKIKEYNLE